MSIANIICQGSRGHLITDSGAFGRDGRIAWLRPKVLELPALRVAITARGHVFARERIGPAVKRATPTSQAELFAILPHLLADEMQADGAFTSPAHEAICATTLYVVYHDRERDRAGGLILSSTTDGMPDGYELFTYLPVREASAPGVDLAAAVGRDADPTDAGSFDPAADGLAIAEAQRREPWSFNGLPRAHYAAGTVRLTTVDRYGVRSRALHRWADQVGELVAA